MKFISDCYEFLITATNPLEYSNKADKKNEKTKQKPKKNPCIDPINGSVGEKIRAGLSHNEARYLYANEGDIRRLFFVSPRLANMAIKHCALIYMKGQVKTKRT